MTANSLRTQFLWPVAWAALVVIGSLLVVRMFSSELIDRTLHVHAESSALTWLAEFTENVPGLAALLGRAPATDAQREFILASMSGSDIFRVELFDETGTLVYLSDQALFDVEPAARFNHVARDIVRSGSLLVEVEDGRGKQDRPGWYVEAYLPIADPEGGVLGVVEVYVDVTGLAAAVAATFDRLSMLLIGAAAFVYLVPTLLLIMRGRQLRNRDRELIRLSRQDPLTGLQNRAAFNEAISRMFAERGEEGATIGLLFIDLDKFKQVNDTLGHDVGDQLLAHVARILRTACRKGDLVARLGGDEFVVVCEDITSDELRDIGERILDQAFTPMVAGTNEVFPGFSIGAHLSNAGEAESRALTRADLAVYRAKANGRGQVVLFSKDLEKKEEYRRTVAGHLRDGMSQRLFYLEYQPICDAGSKAVGFEALLRLHAPDGTPIPPSEFIPIAEDIGLIEDLGRFVLKEAITAAASLPGHCSISVNVSPHEFRSGDLPAYLADVLTQSGTEPERVYLEVTESTVLKSEMSVAKQLTELNEMGIKTALDDFGTGYSSLGYLWQYRFDRLKIDKSFMDGFEADCGRFLHIVETIALLGHQLGTDVVVEGVETEAQYRAAARAGCDLFQGFLFSRPISLDAAVELASQTDVDALRNEA